jgi:GTP-binding protein
MFIDKTKIYVKAGNGGDGTVSFHREKYVTNGGPNGGDGGNGGDVIVKVSSHLNNLVDYYYTKHFKAEAGEKGSKKNKAGKAGKDLILEVPKGTIIKDADTGKIVADMFYEGAEITLLKGGKGGRGNGKFATSVRQAPAFCETGEKTKQREIVLELKTIADVGLVGFPNVGKSTLLSALTHAKPKIANYHFTTLNPNLGVAGYNNNRFLIADIPGLIEGASEGVGLGHDFLRHIERTRMLVHVVDISGMESRDPIEDFNTINKEIQSYAKSLAQLPQIVVLNKVDLLDDEKTNLTEFKNKFSKDYEIIECSAVAHIGLENLKKKIVEKLSKLPKPEPKEVEVFDFDTKDKTSLEISLVEPGVYEVSGGFIQQIIKGVVLSDPYSFAYFQKRLRQDGIIDKLKEKGMQEGDIVRIGDVEFEYTD